MRPWYEKRPSGWLVRWRDIEGRKQSSNLLPSEEQAVRYAQTICLQLSQQLSLESTIMQNSTVHDVTELWISSLAVRSEHTRLHYQSMANAINAELGHRPIRDVTNLEILRFLSHRRKVLRDTSYGILVVSLRRLFAWALENLLIAHNPARTVYAPRGSSHRHRVLSWAEEIQLFDYLAAHHKPCYLHECLACRDTGMRHDNALQLTRGNLQFAPPLLTFTCVKSEVELRLPLTRRLEEALRNYEGLSPRQRLFPHAHVQLHKIFACAEKVIGWRASTHDFRYSFRSHFKEVSQDVELAEYCLGHTLKADMGSYYFYPPTPAKLQEAFQSFSDFQDAEIIGERTRHSIDTASSEEIWKELQRRES